MPSSQDPDTGSGSLLQAMSEMGHEQVVHCHDPETGLRAIIAIYDTTLRVLERAGRDGVTTASAAESLAEERIRAAGGSARRLPGL